MSDNDMKCNNNYGNYGECVQCKHPGHPRPKPIIMECGTGCGFTYSSTNGGESDPCVCAPKAVANVTVDTSCFCRPKTKIEFSSVVHFIPKECSGTVQLEFDLVRCCKDFPECQICTWNYEIENEADRFAKTFSFDYCDCYSCPDCCTYIVKCRPIYVDKATVSVNNCHIAAFAQDSCG